MSPAIPVENYLYLAIVLFSIGAAGVMIRRNAIVVFMCIELMLNAANLVLISFARHHADPAGHIYVLLVMAVAAAEVAVGLAIMIAMFRERKSIHVDDLRDMHG